MYAPEGVKPLLRAGAALDVLDFHQVAGGDQVTVGPLRFSFDQTSHPVTTLAVRVDGAGRSLGYSADTGPEWSLAALGPGLDLALSEATFLSDMEGRLPHLSAREAGTAARRAGAGRLVITHLWPRVDRVASQAEAEAAFDAAVTVASPGDRYLA